MDIKILFIGNDKNVIDVLRHRLTKEGFSFFAVFYENEILSQIKKINPNLAIIDIADSFEQGFRAMELIENDNDLKDIPMIMISNSGNQYDFKKGKILGVDDWITKTDFDLQEIVEKIKNLVKK